MADILVKLFKPIAAPNVVPNVVPLVIIKVETLMFVCRTPVLYALYCKAMSIPNSAELEHIAHLIASARKNHDSWVELRRMKHEFRQRELTKKPAKESHHEDSKGQLYRWPAPGAANFLEKIRRVRSLHVPIMLRGETKLMTHQMINRVFMGPGTGYNGILLVHATGSGKTRTAIEIAEQYAHFMKNKACVIGPGNVRPQFRKEVVSTKGAVFRKGRWELEPRMWAGSVYATAARRVRDPQKVALEAQLSAMVSMRYEFFGWTGLANAWYREDDHRRVQMFSDRVIIVDEAHNLRPVPGQGAAKSVTKALKEIARSCFNVKIVLMTATPMFDRAEEIVDLVNILRCNDDREEQSVLSIFPPDGTVNEGKLREAVRGYISTYTRLMPDPRVPRSLDIRSAAVPGAKHAWPKHTGTGARSKGEATIMHHIPSSALQVVHPALRAGRQRSKTSAPEGAEATNAVFPGGVTGQDGFRAIFDYRPGLYAKGHEKAFAPDNLAKISPKAACITSRILSSEGVVMVYTNFVWAGVKLLAAALEEVGFRPCEFESAVTKEARTRTTGPCYATLADGAEVERILEVARAPSNKDGSRIKVLLCTKVVAEGMDLAFIREVHIFEGWWNLSREAQVIGRAVRYGSHDLLPEDKRNVTVYRYGLTLPGDREGFDHEMARTAMDKYKRIDKVAKILHAESFDCVMHKHEALLQLRDAPSKAVKVKQTTSQGVSVTVAAENRTALEKRIKGLCDGATLEIGDAGVHSGWDVDDLPFRDIVASARDALGDHVLSGTVYTLAQLVQFVGLPDDVAIRAITEILHKALPITPPKSDLLEHGPIGRNLIVLSEDEYALSEADDRRHAIVTIPLALSNASESVNGKDWQALTTPILNSLWTLLSDEEVEQSIVDDMAVDRALVAGASIFDIRATGTRGSRSIERAQGLVDLPRTLAKLSSESAGLVFVAKRGAACSHMSRKAISIALEAKGVDPPPARASRAASCLYAEYALRRLDLVARTDVIKRGVSNGHQEDRDHHENHSTIDHSVRAGTQTNHLADGALRAVVHKTSGKSSKSRSKRAR